MSKVKQNRFLVGYFAVLALAAAAFGYFAWSSYSTAVQARETAEAKRSQLESLQHGRIFPNQENVDAKKKQVDAYASKVEELVRSIYSYQTEQSTLSNTEFQAKLVRLRDGVMQEATDAGVQMPADFSLGMGSYLAEAPKPNAVAGLDAWLDGINFLVRTLIADGVTSIDSLERPPLQFEAGDEAAAPKKEAPARNNRASRAARNEKKTEAPPPDPLTRYPIKVRFTGTSRSVNAALSRLANASPERSEPYFLTIRALRIENQQKEAPARNETVKTGEFVRPDGTKIVRDSMYIYGDEQLVVYLDLELVRFPDLTAAN